MITFKKRIFFIRLLIFFLLLLFLFILLCNLWVILSTRQQVYHDIKLLPRNRVCLVLGTSSKISRTLSNPHFKNRIKAASELYHAGRIKRILVSGDNRTFNYNEPRDMTRALIDLNVPSEHIKQDYAGLRTFDSVVRSKDIFQQEKITIVSDKFHVYRALFIANKKGIKALAYPSKDTGRILFKTKLREILARVIAVCDLYILNKKPYHGGDKIIIN